MKNILTYLWQHGVIAVMCVSLIFMTACSVDQVLSDIDLALQASENIAIAVGTVSPSDAAAIQVVAGIGIAGMKAIQDTYDAYEANKTAGTLKNLQAALTAVQTSLTEALAAAHIVDPSTVLKVTAWVNLVITTTNIIASAVGNVASNPNSKLAKIQLATAIPTPEALHTRWLNEVCSGNVACGKLVKVHHKRT